jgi:deoxyadenosine/deoxycytidine kinase
MIKKILISVDGNIGVGKTTFIKMLQKKLDSVEVIFEPVEEWCGIKNKEGENILGLFYKDKTRWGYTFQNMAYITRLLRILEVMKKSDKQIIITDRSMETDKNIFGYLCYKDKHISELEWNIYNYWNHLYDTYLTDSNTNFHIYLRAPPDVVYNRIMKRGREEEKTISLKYLTDLHNLHDKWLYDNKKDNILTIECSDDFENNKEIFDDMLQNIIEYIDSIK